MSRKKIEKGLAKIVYISDFHALEYKLDRETGEVGYEPHSNVGGKPFPNFPVLIQGNGEPWTLGNIYLTQKLVTRGKLRNMYNPKTWANHAESLKKFLRWLEATKTDPLDFNPIHAEYRPTYRFRAYLEEQIRLKRASGNKRGVGLSPNTAGETMSAVHNFYKTLTHKSVLTPEVLDLGWEKIRKLVKVIGYDLTTSSKTLIVESTDQAVRRPKSVQDPNKVEGKLTPLTADQQDVIDTHIANSPITMQLIFATARLTGARLQTVCTLRGSTLREAVYSPENDHYLVHVGGSKMSLCNTKGDKEETLVFPKVLHEKLTTYWNGNVATSRRIESMYGNTLENYLFLTQNGTSYYASKKEMDDLRDPRYHNGVEPTAAMKKSIDRRKGQTVEDALRNLIKRIQRLEPGYEDFKFKFHDLRATFGMNTLKHLIDNEGMKASDALEKVCELMNHSNIRVTTTYLDFRNYKGKTHGVKAQKAIESRLLSKVTDEALNYDYS